MSASQRLPAWLAAFPSTQVRELDPRRHALIEASAGTGKTFAIEHLVLRLLVENSAWNPEEILLLSFTEKTVAELRDRIRALLRAQVDESDPKKRIEGWSDADRDRIRKRWLHADDIAVHTLHAFCQSAVRRDPIANGALIRTELAEDRALADIALDGLLRGAWATDATRRARLTEALGIDAGDAWRKRLVTLALSWQPWRDDVFDPERDPDTLEALLAQAAEPVRDLFDAVAAAESGGYSAEAHRASFALTATGRTKKNPEEARDKDPWEKVFRFAEARRADAPDKTRDPDAALEFFKATFSRNTRVVKHGWESELPVGAQGLSEWKRLASACESIRKLADVVADSRNQRRLGLLAEAARELRAALDAEKLRLGRISYDDMPRRLVEALRRNPALAPRLRDRYKVCIVDEFQDTDPIQWEILRRLCLQDSPGDVLDDESPSPAHPSRLPTLPLFLVGDPKQAIYAFRGGDLRTYVRARNEFLRLAKLGWAQGIGLNANFRSRPMLIEALNRLFAHPDWFGDAPETPEELSWRLPGATEGVAFVPVQAGLQENGVAGPALVLRDFQENGSGAEIAAPASGGVRRDVRRWIVARILESLRDGKARPGDFAVLARGNAEGEAIARLLRQRGVPCRIRRKGGPFHGAVADALRLLLEWIDDAADPDAQARILLLPFARRDARDLPAGRPAFCPPRIARWAALARAGQWPEFLNSVMHEGGYRERLAAASPADAARLDRLIQILAEAGSVPGTSARALCARFDALRRGEADVGDDSGEGDEGDSEEDAKDRFVTVMTMHLSKGLEFRHVFVAATGTGNGGGHLTLRDEDRAGFRIVLDTKREDDKEQADREAHAEDQRLYYVAFTRAKETLHVPVLPGKLNRVRVGPLGGFVASAVRSLANDPEMAGHVRWDKDPVQPEEFATSVVSEGPEATPPDREKLMGEARAAFSRRRRLTSFSRLALHAGNPPVEVRSADPLLEEDGTRVQRQEPAADAPEDEAAPAATGITATELPPGAPSGTALHALLEHTSFASVLETENPESWLALPGQRPRVEEALRREGVDPGCAPAAARAIWNALRSPIPDPAQPGKATFRLADLDAHDLRHEVEFLLPLTGKPRHEGALPEGVTRKGPFLWGFIDLVFRREGRYYLLDWKSNLLRAYDDASVAQSMEKHAYHLQWKLYAVALDRWLAERLPDYDPGKHFGGVCYLFLRGARPDFFAGFRERPTPEQLRATFPAEIAALLAAPAGRREAA